MAAMIVAAFDPLLCPTDPAPVSLVNPTSAAPVLLLCEHAGFAIPAALGDLGLSVAARASHISWDIGAEDVARALATRLDAPLIVQNYSRLVIDSNRPPGTPGSVPVHSAGVAVPGNAALSTAQQQARRTAIFDPLDRAIVDGLTAHPRRAVFSIHSFTPDFPGQGRPWHAGFLSRCSLSTARHLMASVARAAPTLTLALNEPYQIEDETDWFIPAHAEARNLPHCLIEIRNDQIATPDGAAVWADLLGDAITDLLEDLP